MSNSLFSKFKKKFSRKDAYIYHASIHLLIRKPRLIAKLIRLYSIYFASRRNPLRLLDIAITEACPYNCPHCYPEGFYGVKRVPLTVDEIADAVRQGQEMGVVQFNFQGGEPTLDLQRLKSILIKCDPWSSYISLSSNGFRYKIHELKRIYRMGVDKIALSLHSGIPEEHDKFVGSVGAYERVFKCMKNSRQVGLETSLAIVVTRDNIFSEGVKRVFDLCIERDIILDVNVAIPVGKWSGKKQYLLQDEAYTFLDELNNRHPNIRRDIHPHLFREGCLAAKELLYINIYGDVLTCPFLHFNLGNIRDQSLKILRLKALNNEWFKQYQRKCLACEDNVFFEKYITKVFDSGKSPMNWDDVF